VAVIADPAEIRPPGVAAPNVAAPKVEERTLESAGLRLIPFESVKGGAEAANRPWLQELPDPMSTVMWASWAELAPVDAARLGVETGDRVRITPAGTVAPQAAALEAVAFVTPAARPGTVATPIGGGDGRGRFARGRSAHLHLLAAAEVEGVGVAALGDVTVTVEKLARAPRAAVYGRGLRRAEEIPRGWRPHLPRTRGQAAGEARERVDERAPEPAEGEQR
jgi:hypothetical protein